MATSASTPSGAFTSTSSTFTEEDAKALAALQAKQTLDAQQKQEAVRVSQKAALAPIAKVLNQKLIDDLMQGLNDTLRNTQDPDTIALVTGLKQGLTYQGGGLLNLIAAVDQPIPVPPTVSTTA